MAHAMNATRKEQEKIQKLFKLWDKGHIFESLHDDLAILLELDVPDQIQVAESLSLVPMLRSC